MHKGTELTNHFLIAMPGLRDPNFARSLTYVCEHSEHGAMGIVVNRPTELRLGDILEQMEITASDPSAELEPVYSGGPVQPDRGFVLHTSGDRWASTLRITPRISLTTSRDILEAIAAGEGPEQRLIALGYAGWGSGQLENEMLANAWLSGPADLDIVFNRPVEERWYAAARLLGVDMHLMTTSAGHA
jgi:putative transcriptional regulator